MPFALPFVRSASDDAAEVRLAGLGLAAIAIFLFSLAAFWPQVLGDGDTWSHVATGEWIIAHGAVPRADPFSYSMPGAPWTAHEWLAEVPLAFRFGGWSAVALLTGAAAATAALIVGLRAARDLCGAPLVAAVAIGLSLMTANLLARPLWRRHSSATISPGRSLLRAAGSSPRSIESPAGGASIRARPPLSKCGRRRLG